MLEREESRKPVAKQAKATQAWADPGELKSDKVLCDWHDKCENSLSAIPGKNGAPLSCTIRLDSTPEHQHETLCSTFLHKSIGCALHSGATCISGKRKVHQLLISHLSPVMRQWIEHVKKKKDGRENYESLKNYCLGTRHVSKRIAHAEKIKKEFKLH